MGSFVLSANIGRREFGGVFGLGAESSAGFLFGRREFGGALLGAGWVFVRVLFVSG
jgi:hypothetical protein